MLTRRASLTTALATCSPGIGTIRAVKPLHHAGQAMLSRIAAEIIH
jgi:hypothetical protein